MLLGTVFGAHYLIEAAKAHRRRSPIRRVAGGDEAAHRESATRGRSEDSHELAPLDASEQRLITVVLQDVVPSSSPSELVVVDGRDRHVSAEERGDQAVRASIGSREKDKRSPRETRGVRLGNGGLTGASYPVELRG